MKTNSKNQVLHCVAISLLAQLFYQAPCFAQAPGGAPVAGGVVIEVVQNDPKLGTGVKVTNAKKQAQNFLDDRKLEQGFDQKNNMFIAIGSAPITVLAGGDGFDGARQDAFLLALLEAKQKLAEFMGVQVAVELEKIIKNGTPGQLAPSKPVQNQIIPNTLIEKALLIVNAEANEQLKKRGAEDQGKNKDDAAAKENAGNKKNAEAAREKELKLVLDESFRETLAIGSRAEIAGSQVYRTFESVEQGKKGTVAVVMIYNSVSEELTRALLGKGPAPRGIPNSNPAQWVKNLGDEVLLYTQGAQMRTNENGEVILVAFGQSTPLGEDADLAKVAEDEARAAAQGSARLFLGDLIESQSDAVSGFDLKKYKDGKNISEDYKNLKKRLAKLKDVAAGPELIKGSFPIYEWDFKHPLSDITTQGCVITCSLSAAQAANALRDKFESIGGSKGGEGVTSRPPQEPDATQSPNKKGSSTGAGAEGDLIVRPIGGAGAPGQF